MALDAATKLSMGRGPTVPLDIGDAGKTSYAETPTIKGGTHASNVFAWFTSAHDAPLVGSISLVIAVISLLVTVVGFWVAIRTALQAKTAAEAADQASKHVVSEINKYDAIKDISFSLYALESASKHFRNGAWNDVAESYDDANRSLTRLRSRSNSIDEDSRKYIDQIVKFSAKLHERIDAGEFNNESSRLKTHAVIRQHISNIFDVSILIEKAVVR